MRAQPYKHDSSNKKELDELIVRMMVEDLQPLSIVEGKGFRLVHGLNPKYELPSHREISRTLFSLYVQPRSRKSEERARGGNTSL